ncbi:hypothetical protein 035JT004_123 [Bacillus phage 035JT004]|nr:hypothetical protein 035JT004_123 [Bacillus phage 035JT004]
MIINGLKEYKGTLKKVYNLLNDTDRGIQGVYYTNSFFSQRYLTKSFAVADYLNITDNSINLKIVTRVEKAGILELESTNDMLLEYAAGEVKAFSLDPEEAYAHNPTTAIPEPVSVNTALFPFDIELFMKDPVVTYQEVTIAGSKFTLVNLHQVLDKEKELEQTVSLLFGERDRLTFFSHLLNKTLTSRDVKLILDLIIDENITGRAVKSVSFRNEEGVVNTIFPYEELINSYRSSGGNYVFGTGHGFLRIPKEGLHKYQMTVESFSDSKNLEYQLVLESAKSRIILNMD